jgi:hypothetical protein
VVDRKRAPRAPRPSAADEALRAEARAVTIRTRRALGLGDFITDQRIIDEAVRVFRGEL